MHTTLLRLQQKQFTFILQCILFSTKWAPNSLGKLQECEKNPGISGGNCNMVAYTVIPQVSYCNASGVSNIIVDWKKNKKQNTESVAQYYSDDWTTDPFNFSKIP